MNFFFIFLSLMLVPFIVLSYAENSLDYTEAKIEWSQHSFGIINGTGTAQIILTDFDILNLSNDMDSVTVFVYSDSFPEGIDLILYETGVNTGIFERTFSLSDTYTAPSVLRAVEGDTVTVTYFDDTLPLDYVFSEIHMMETSIIRTPDLTLEQVPINNTRNADNTKQDFNNLEIKSPLKQFKMGVKYQDIQCRDGLELVGKMPYAYPNCVYPESVEKLVIRGWATSNKSLDLVNSEKYLIEKNNIPFEIKYSLKGATLEKIYHDADANSIYVELNDSTGGYLVLSVPHQLIGVDVDNLNDSNVLFILIDGLENMYGEKITDTSKIITIWFPAGSHEIEIVGAVLI